MKNGGGIGEEGNNGDGQAQYWGIICVLQTQFSSLAIDLKLCIAVVDILQNVHLLFKKMGEG